MPMRKAPLAAPAVCAKILARHDGIIGVGLQIGIENSGRRTAGVGDADAEGTAGRPCGLRKNSGAKAQAVVFEFGKITARTGWQVGVIDFETHVQNRARGGSRSEER